MMIFLDDIRSPSECASYMHKRIGALNPLYIKGDWYIVRNYDSFTEAITKYLNDITHVSFDHDLADCHYDPDTWTESFVYQEKTGYDCAKWMKEYYEYRKKDLPIMFVHSMNPVGTERIINLFK
jgi:hypothetical protein